MFACYFVAVMLHEAAHAFAGRYCGYEMKKIVLMPYGAMIYGGEKFRDKEGLKIAIAGPLSSGLCALLTLSVCWIVPELYDSLSDFLSANIMLLVLNLLPCFPLDGARIVLALFTNKMKALFILKILGILVSVIMIAFGIASFWFVPNITLISTGAFILIGALFGSKKEEYYFVASKMSYAKDYVHGVTERCINVSIEMRVYILLRYVSDKYITTFKIVDKSGTSIMDFSEVDVQNFILKSNPSTKISEII